MSSNLVNLIFNQFVEIVIKLAKKSNCDVDECDFNYRVRELVGHRLIDVIFVAEDNCGRRRDVVISIDFTSICFSDLTTCSWVAYLEKLAAEYVCDICPKKLMVVKNELKKCRPQPAKWCPLPCRNTTTIIKKKPYCPPEPECEVIICQEDECIPVCERKPCCPKKEIIVKYQSEKPWKCGDCTTLVTESEGHDFVEHKGNKDYNHHQWKGLNKGCGCGGSASSEVASHH